MFPLTRLMCVFPSWSETAARISLTFARLLTATFFSRSAKAGGDASTAVTVWNSREPTSVK